MYLVLHFLSQLLNGLDLVPLFLVDPDLALHLFCLDLGSEALQVLFSLLLPLNVVGFVGEVAVKLGLVDVEVFEFLPVLADQVGQLVLVLEFILSDVVVNGCNFVLEALDDLLQTLYLLFVLFDAFFVLFGL